jgi:hypothetical protein
MLYWVVVLVACKEQDAHGEPARKAQSLRLTGAAAVALNADLAAGQRTRTV